MPAHLTILRVDDVGSFTAAGRFLTVRWRQPPTSVDLKEVSEVIRSRAQVAGEAVVLTVIVEASVPPLLPAAERRACIELMNDQMRNMGYLMSVIEGSSLWRSAIRGILTSLVLGARMRAPWKIVSTPHEAVEALSDKLALLPTEIAELEATLRRPIGLRAA